MSKHRLFYSACVAAFLYEANRIRATQKSFLHSGCLKNGARAKKLQGGEGKEGILFPQTLNFEKSVCPRMGLLVGVAWSS